MGARARLESVRQGEGAGAPGLPPGGEGARWRDGRTVDEARDGPSPLRRPGGRPRPPAGAVPTHAAPGRGVVVAVLAVPASGNRLRRGAGFQDDAAGDGETVGVVRAGAEPEARGPFSLRQMSLAVDATGFAVR